MDLKLFLDEAKKNPITPEGILNTISQQPLFDG